MWGPELEDRDTSMYVRARVRREICKLWPVDFANDFLVGSCSRQTRVEYTNWQSNVALIITLYDMDGYFSNIGDKPIQRMG